MKTPICFEHNVELEDQDCPRCGGKGYTDSDIEDMDNPIDPANGDCYQCKGTGVIEKSFCEDCYRSTFEEFIE